ncbi:amidohydrolase family protein [Robiginitalea sp.]|uniref:amidohydrolase family protein n=1 Tax=Robiginitalea sp. TaxID=1902411 RepID=UPI003C765052
MTKSLYTFILLSFFLGTLHAQELTFEEYNPESTLVVPEHPITRAKFPVIDVHSHHNMAETDLSVVVRAMDTLNLAVLVNLSGGSGEKLKAGMANIQKNYPNRFLQFANVDFSGVGETGWGTRAAAQLKEDYANGAVGLKIFKSLGLRYTDTDGNRVAVDDARLDPVWEMCAVLGIPVLIHAADPKSFWDPMDSNNERWLELKTRPRRKRSATDPAPWEQIIAEQHNLFRKHPKTIFINAHMGWYANNLDRLSELMEEFPNMYVGIGAIIAELGRQPRRAKAFFIAYQDRILFGKDSWQPSEFPTYFRVLETADEYFPYHKKYHAFWAMYGLDLPDAVLKKVYYQNALKIVPNLDPTLFPKP